jgi:hypothetical protein
MSQVIVRTKYEFDRIFIPKHLKEKKEIIGRFLFSLFSFSFSFSFSKHFFYPSPSAHLKQNHPRLQLAGLHLHRVRNGEIIDDLLSLEQKMIVTKYKFGVLNVTRGQTTEDESK